MNLLENRNTIGMILALFFPIALISGCTFNQGVPAWSGSGFLRDEFLSYKSVGILPFEGDESGEVVNAFRQSFKERFPQIPTVGTGELLATLRGMGISTGIAPDRLDEATRKGLGKALGAEALVLGDVIYQTITTWILQVVIVDVETGRVLGRSTVQIGYMGAEGYRQGARFAVEKLTVY